MRTVMRRLSYPPVGVGTGGGPACVPGAPWASSGAWTAGAAAGTQCRASGVPCRPPPVPAPRRFQASSPVKCGISVKSKHSVGKGRKDMREGGPNSPGAYHPHPLLPCLFSTIKTSPTFPRDYPGQGGPGDKHRFVLITP